MIIIIIIIIQCFIQAHFGGKFPPKLRIPPQELEARSVYYVNVIPVSLQSAQNLQSNSDYRYLLTHLL